MQLTYRVRVQQHAVDQYTAHIPALPGCFTCGNTQQQVVQIARDLIESYLQHLALRGRSVPVEPPDPSTTDDGASIEVITVHAPLPVIA